MSAQSPIVSKMSLVTFTIEVDGDAIDNTYQIISIDTWNGVNKVPKARITLYDGSAAKSNFEISDNKVFIPGNKLRISAGYNSQEQEIFNGTIVKQGIEISRDQGSRLIVDVTDAAIKMTLERKNALFGNIKDSDLIGRLIKDNGLDDKVTATNNVEPKIVQYYTSDWDMMMTRAQMNSFIVIVDGGTVTVQPPDTGQAADLKVKYGDSILDLQMDMNAADQYSKSAIKSYSWDIGEQKVIESGPGNVKITEPGNISSSKLAEVFKVKNFTQQTGGPINKTSLQDWSSAELQRSILAKIRGTVTFQGSALAKTGKTIELAGLGQRFNGTAFISGVHHSIYSGKWLTRVEVGMSSQWFAASTPHISALDASGQLPPIKGLQTGIVKQIDKDPEGEFRVQVIMPILQDDSKAIWVRLGNFYASNKVGAEFYPELKDEVVIGFMNEDPRYGVILGSLYSKKLSPPYPPDKENTKKAIKTKGELEILFEDQDKIITTSTPGKQSIKIDDKDKSITIADSNSNTISMSNSGISLDSGSDIKLSAKGNINLDAKSNVMVKATSKVSVRGVSTS
ncbi:MAG: type VI secretion system tip protein VgrG [Proteobacteria bacterium]|nr:type VI secretion system tip protein VgrG [Pseudomonadota bacterium]